MNFIKSILILGSFLVTQNSFAVVTADCPHEFTVALSDFTPEILLPDLSDFRYPEDAVVAHSELKSMPEVVDTFTLDNKHNSICTYKGLNTKGANISGSLNPNAKEKARILIRWTYVTASPEYIKNINPRGTIGLQTYIPIKDLKPNKIELSFPNGYATLYNSNQKCGWGDCATMHVRIGRVNKVNVNVK